MTKPHILFGWHLSYFSGKARAYLKYKAIPFIDRNVDMYTLMVRIKRATGAVVMPVLKTADGQWVQDTSVIIDMMEAKYPHRSVIPTTPTQRFAAYLLEAWGDEWWIPIAMHTRWSYPENYALFEKEAGDNLLPGFPRLIKRRAAAKVAGKLRGMLGTVGVRPNAFGAMEEWSVQMLDHLDNHFEQYPYLLGDCPSIGDFGLLGPMYGHLGRDPWPAREWIAPRKHVRAWIDRMANPDMSSTGGFVEGDKIPETLTPVFAAIFREFVPMLESINEQVLQMIPKLNESGVFPRALGSVTHPMGEHQFIRRALPFVLWMVQRVLDVYRSMDRDEQTSVRTWLQTLGGEALLEINIPRLRRENVHVALSAYR